MWDPFVFPKQYIVKKEMGKDRFLNNANLTPRERETIETYVDDIQVLYDIRCCDEDEIIVFGADVKRLKNNYTPHLIASSIAASLPYHSLIVLYYYEYVYFYMFNTRENKYDPRRRRKTEWSSTASVWFQGKSGARICGKRLNTALEQADTTNELISYWRSILRSTPRG